MNTQIIKLQSTQELEESDVEVFDEITDQAKVILYNDEWHTFDEVIAQLIKALHCSQDHAEALTWEVHNKGKAIVFGGDISECLRVSSVLEEIDLHTQIEY